MAKILIFVTNHAVLGETSEKNGTYAPELTHALHEFTAAGFDYDIASIKGGAAPLYGEEAEDDVNQTILADAKFQAKIANTTPVSDINKDEYVAVFYPGGFGLLSDLAKDTTHAAITAAMYESGKPVGAVCHGPAGLLPVTLSSGKKLLADKHVTGFTREEEIDFGTLNNIPFLLEESLARQAARFTKIQPWGENVISDGLLITGQNPASAHGVGQAMVALLKA